MERPRVPLRAFAYIFIFTAVAAGTLYYYRASVFPSEATIGTLSEEEKYVLLDGLSSEIPAFNSIEKLKLLDTVENGGALSDEEKINILKSLE